MSDEAVSIPAAPPRLVVRSLELCQRLLVRLSRRLSPPQFALLDMAVAKWRSACLEAVAKLGVADRLEDGPQDVGALAATLEVDEESLYRVLRALARDGVFKEVSPRTFALNSLSRPLLSASPNSVRDMIRQLGSDWGRSLWARIERAVETGDPVFNELYGSNVWEYFDKHPEDGKVFHGSMVNLTRQVAGVVATSYDFSRFKTLVDLGGGSAELISVILVKHPGLMGINFDSSQALKEAPATLDRYGVSQRCELMEGSFFEVVPPGHDAYLMKNIVHEFSDEKLERPMTLCRQAMIPSSRLLLVESVVPERGPYLQFLDILMLIGAEHGRERTRSQFVALLDRYGFALERIVHTASPTSILVARPA